MRGKRKLDISPPNAQMCTFGKSTMLIGCGRALEGWGVPLQGVKGVETKRGKGGRGVAGHYIYLGVAGQCEIIASSSG